MPHKGNLLYWLYFGILCIKNGDTKVDPHWVQDPPWFFFGPCHGNTQHGPLYIGFIFAFYATEMGSMDSWETKVDPHSVQDPPWSFNGPCHGPTIHQTWPFIYQLYFCIQCNKNWIKGLWGHKGQPSLGLGPVLVFQGTLLWPYNKLDMVLYIQSLV